MQFLTIQPQERARIFIKNVLFTNRGFNYYVDWSNIDGYQEFQVEIHALDILIRCRDELFYEKFKNLVTKLPSVILLFPYLFGLAKSERENLYKGRENLVLIQEELDKNDYLEFIFSKTAIKNFQEDDIKVYYDFFVQMGLKHLYQNIIEKSTLDYIAGVLVGMDSNGRKNRGGKVFELACPEWVKIVESGMIEEPSTKDFVKKYLDKMMENKPDKIVLGCTHYPYLRRVLSDVLGNDIFIDPSIIFSNYIKYDLEKHNMLNTSVENGSEEFFVSANSKEFQNAAKMFYELKEAPSLVEFAGV